MLSQKELKEIVASYRSEPVGHIRQSYLDRLIPALKRKEILVLKGIRRCGKTTLLKQLQLHLLGEGVKKEHIMYVNLDDYRFLPYLTLELLEFIAKQVDRAQRCYLFLDEIQKIPSFEAWLRTMYDQEVNIKFIVSGSNATMFSKEFGTLLTGRNLTYEIFPLSYTEYEDFSPASSFDEYLTYGGFPEVVMEKNSTVKHDILRNYVTDIINKDILQRRTVLDPTQLLHFAQYLLKNPGVRISVNRLAKETQINKETVRNYINYMKDAYLVIEVPFFSYSAKSKFIPNNIPKFYSIDNGFCLVTSPRKEEGKLYENLVAQHLFRQAQELHYWKDKNEVDFVISETAINVVSSKEIPAREKEGLSQIQKAHRHIRQTILVTPETTAETLGIIEFLRSDLEKR